MTAAAAARKTALIMGVANHRSIAWACVESFLQRPGEYDQIIFTYQNERYAKTANDLIQQLQVRLQQQQQQQAQAAATSSLTPSLPLIVALPCNVETELASLFHERIPEALNIEEHNDYYNLDAIVHSIAYAPDMKNGIGGLLNTSKEAFLQAHTISAYSLLETTQLALPMLQRRQKKRQQRNCGDDNVTNAGVSFSTSSSITTLSYLGAIRAVPNYNIMGPAKASLEALVRGLALEINNTSQDNPVDNNHVIRINCVNAGPLNTMSGRGIMGMTQLRQHYEQYAPLRRNVTVQQVADTVRFLASSTDASGITGQTIYVDSGYCNIVPI